jgi:hypothetical protein
LIPAFETPGFTTGGLIVIFFSYHTAMEREILDTEHPLSNLWRSCKDGN